MTEDSLVALEEAARTLTRGGLWYQEDVLALVAEVRRLQSQQELKAQKFQEVSELAKLLTAENARLWGLHKLWEEWFGHLRLTITGEAAAQRDTARAVAREILRMAQAATGRQVVSDHVLAVHPWLLDVSSSFLVAEEAAKEPADG